MALDLLQLRAVSVAARLGSLTRTAEALNITQPALSRRISDAERSLGVLLFERLPRGVKATEACLAFLRHAEIALASIDDGIEAALAAEQQQRPEVSISLLDALCDDVLVAACKATLSAFSINQIDFKTHLLSANVSSDLLSGAAKLGLRYRRDPRPHLDAMWIADDPLVVACAPSHPFAATRKATMEDLERAQWIGYPIPIDQTAATPDEALRTSGLQHWRATDVTTLAARIRLIEAGFGVGLVRRSGVAAHLRRGTLIELDTPVAVSMPIFVTWRRGSYLGPAAEFLRDQLAHHHRG
jgi:DNA-binding transcriptional LysR family regulator